MTSDPTPRAELARVWSKVTDLEIVRGYASTVVTSDGDEYLDFTSGIAVTNTGHAHPDVVRAIQEQAACIIHAQANVVSSPLRVALAARLGEITPTPIDTFFFTNSGAEAVEAAVKLARAATRRQNVVVFDGSFHGRTHLTMAMTNSKAQYRAGAGPLPAGIHVAPYPATEADVSRALEALHRVFATQTRPDDTAAIVIEPVLGEGGYVPAPSAFLQAIRRLCSDAGIVLVFDEVQSGFGRTGKMFALQHAGVVPDILVMGKGLGSGFPISAIGARRELADRWPVGSHGGTYGGNPVGCAAALATIDVISAPGFLDTVTANGQRLADGLRRIQRSASCLLGVRGLGLMIGAQFADGALAARIIEHCLLEGQIILMGAGADGSVIRFMPPLVVTVAEIDRLLEAFERAVAATGTKTRSAGVER